MESKLISFESKLKSIERKLESIENQLKINWNELKVNWNQLKSIIFSILHRFRPVRLKISTLKRLKELFRGGPTLIRILHYKGTRVQPTDRPIDPRTNQTTNKLKNCNGCFTYLPVCSVAFTQLEPKYDQYSGVAHGLRSGARSDMQWAWSYISTRRLGSRRCSSSLGSTKVKFICTVSPKNEFNTLINEK